MTIDTPVEWAAAFNVLLLAGLIGALIATIAVEGRRDRRAEELRALHAHIAQLERRMIDAEIQGLARPEQTMQLPRYVEDRGWLPPAPTTRVERRQMTTELTVATVPVAVRRRPAFQRELARIGA